MKNHVRPAVFVFLAVFAAGRISAQTVANWYQGTPTTAATYTAGRVGIGTTAPSNVLHIFDPNSGVSSAQLLLEGRLAAYGAGISFASKVNNGGVGGTLMEMARITADGEAAWNTDAGQQKAGLRIFTTNNGSLGERMRITGDGRLAIGTQAPAALLHIYDPTADVSSAQVVLESRQAGYGAGISFRSKLTPLATEATPLQEMARITADGEAAWNMADVNSRNAGLRLFTTNAGSSQERIRIDHSGNVGIGTTLAGIVVLTQKLHVEGEVRATGFRTLLSHNTAQVRLGSATAEGTWAVGLNQNGSGDFFVQQIASNQVPFSIAASTTNAAAIQMIAAVNITGNVFATGTIRANGGINAVYQDVAEWVPSSERVNPGTVVTLDLTRNNEVIASTKPYDTAVAGVISARPGVILGEAGTSKVAVATTGRVKVHADASHGPIAIGDLLVSGDKPGTAMRSVPTDIGGLSIHRPGTIVGKALEPLPAGEGDILILLSLQ
jgi:hypothetical protein